jgi:hypothetical protein
MHSLSALASARQIADYAEGLGIKNMQPRIRATFSHLGAALADAILQAGMNYRNVVKARVERIIRSYPETALLLGTVAVVQRGSVSEFLMWNHPVKIERFINLVRVLEHYDVQDTSTLREWLQRDECRRVLLQVVGIGPKTVDYLSGLVGIDCAAVDRHVKVFASQAGVYVTDYDKLKTLVSYAADLLGISRRDFDTWIWNLVSTKSPLTAQYALL